MSNAGRKRILDEKKRGEVCAILSAGAGMKTAAKYVGCTVKTIQREAQRDEVFGEKLRHSEAQSQLTYLSNVREAAGSQWRAASWMLERTDPERFGRAPKPAFGKLEARQLGRELVKLFRQEVKNPLVQERVEMRMWAAIEFATRQSFDSDRSGYRLRQAMEFFAKKEEELNPLEELYREAYERVRPSVKETEAKKQENASPAQCSNPAGTK